MDFLLFVALLVAVTILPVMIGARLVRARNTGAGPALFAVVLLALLAAIVEHFLSGPVLAFAVSTIAGGLILAGVLGTTLLRGLLVSVVVVAAQFLVATVVIGMAGSVNAVS